MCLDVEWTETFFKQATSAERLIAMQILCGTKDFRLVDPKKYPQLLRLKNLYGQNGATQEIAIVRFQIKQDEDEEPIERLLLKNALESFLSLVGILNLVK